MKVVLLSGSPKNNGNTVEALKICAAEIEKQGIETEILTLAGKHIGGCVDCQGCKTTGNCIMKDGLDEIIDKIKDAEGFIIGAPVYFGTARGDIMSAVQRIGRVARANGNWLNGKVGGPVVVGRRGGHTATLSEMLMVFFISGMIVPGSSYWNMMFGGAAGEVLEDAEGIQTVATFGENVATVITKMNA